MPVRDDSVIRGGLIASSIFLVLSLIANFLFWRMGNIAATEAQEVKTQLQSATATIQKQQNQLGFLKGAIGIGTESLNEASMNALAESAKGDADMETAIATINTALSYFGPGGDFSQKNLSRLPEYLTQQLRGLSDQYNNAVAQQQLEKARADADIKVARDAQAKAEQLQATSEKEKEDLRTQFDQDRQQMKLANGDLQDKVNRALAENRKVAQDSALRIDSLQTEKSQLLTTIESQRRELNELRNSTFEVAQGKVTYTRPGDRLVMINLGSRDQLRNGVNFEVHDAEDSRVVSGKPKAMIEVVAIRGDHLAEARLIGDEIISDPIIPGDRIYSPFWAPGRSVRIALAGSIDINQDGRIDDSDTSILRGAIESAGAEIAAVITPGARRTGKELDSGIRFLVTGQQEAESDNPQAELTERQQRSVAEMGKIIDEARQLGITVVPAEKLLGFLRTIDDSITVPLGNTARADDFRPLPAGTGRLSKESVSDLYQKAPPRGN